MGMLEGFLVGATDEYTKQRGEDRQEGREIKKEKRIADFQEIRDKRLAETAEGVASKLVETNAGAVSTKVETDAAVAATKVETDEAAAVSATERKRMDPIEVSPSSSIATPQEGGGYKFDQAPHKPATSTTGQFTAEDATKFFSKRGDVYFGTLDESGLYTLGTDENAQLASAASSVANRLWLQKQGGIDANTIWAVVYKNIKANKATTAADIKSIGDQLTTYDDMWWNTEAESDEVIRLKKDQERIEKEGKAGQMDLPGQRGGGMLDEGTATELPPAALNKLKEGVVTTFSNGQKWTLRNGKPAQVQ